MMDIVNYTRGMAMHLKQVDQLEFADMKTISQFRKDILSKVDDLLKELKDAPVDTFTAKESLRLVCAVDEIKEVANRYVHSDEE